MSFISQDSQISTPHFGHAWRTDDGASAVVRLGRAELYFQSPQDARDVAAACGEAAEALDELLKAQREDGTAS